MRVYENKEELKTEINKTFEKYIVEFDNIPESLKDKRIDEVDRTPAENLAYQVGWTTLVLKWEEDERNGLQVKTPSDEFKWNQLGELYQWFTDTYAYLSLQELKSKLNENINSIYVMIDSLSDEKAGVLKTNERIDLYDALKSLSQKEHDVIKQRYFEGLSQSEIAKELFISQAQVSRIEKKALNTLHNYLK